MNNFVYDEIIDEQIEMPTFEPKPVIVDRAVVFQHTDNLWYVDGFLTNVKIVRMGGWETQDEHVNAVLYDADGNEVPHEIQEQSNSNELEERIDVLEKQMQGLEEQIVENARR